MLREEDIQIWKGRAAHGGDFLRLTHVPTGISRNHPGPLCDVDLHNLRRRWLAEIEAELREGELHQYIVPDYPSKNTWQHRHK